MEWKNIINLKRFLPLQDVFIQIGQPLFKFEGRPVYYMGDGFLIIGISYYSPHQNKRIYAIVTKHAIKKYPEQYCSGHYLIQHFNELSHLL